MYVICSDSFLRCHPKVTSLHCVSGLGFHDGVWVTAEQISLSDSGRGYVVCVFCNADLVAINFFRFSLSWKIFISPLILKYSFAVPSSLGWQLFRTRKTSLHALLTFKICVEKSAIIMTRCLYKILAFLSNRF